MAIPTALAAMAVSLIASAAMPLIKSTSTTGKMA